jgi:hypothetical protein
VAVVVARRLPRRLAEETRRRPTVRNPFTFILDRPSTNDTAINTPNNTDLSAGAKEVEEENGAGKTTVKVLAVLAFAGVFILSVFGNLIFGKIGNSKARATTFAKVKKEGSPVVDRV